MAYYPESDLQMAHMVEEWYLQNQAWQPEVCRARQACRSSSTETSIDPLVVLSAPSYYSFFLSIRQRARVGA